MSKLTLLHRIHAAALAIGCALALSNSASAATTVPAGVWLWDTGDAAVEFHTCDANLCARVVWVKEESAPDASVLLDTHNPDAARRSRHICGLDYITGLHKTANGDWKGGWVYDFHAGKTYDLDIDAAAASEVRMRGYKGLRLLGATLILVRPKGTTLACKVPN